MEVNGRHHSPSVLSLEWGLVSIQVGAGCDPWPGGAFIGIRKYTPIEIRTPVYPARSLVAISTRLPLPLPPPQGFLSCTIIYKLLLTSILRYQIPLFC